MRVPRTLHLVVLAALLVTTAALTLLLKINGGPHNPFSILFLVVAGIGALLLGPRSLVFLVAAILASLGFLYSAVPGSMEHMHDMASYSLHLKGMWLANSIGVFLVCGWIYYLKRINERATARQARAEKVLADVERIESVGRLAAQAAHQMNTPLGTLQLGLSEIGDTKQPLSDSEQKRWIEDMQHALNQVSNIVSQIKFEEKFSGNEGVKPLRKCVEESVLRWSSPRKIEIPVKNNVVPEIPAVSSSFANDLDNILMALLDNALDASNGNVSISVSVKEKEKGIELVVQDKGKGMDSETKRKALDPLFTTKAKGTGLGLYVCHQIAKKHGGNVAIESEVGCGTQVSVLLQRGGM